MDRKANTKNTLQFVALPNGEVPQTAFLHSQSQGWHGVASPEVSEFEVASMKLLTSPPSSEVKIQPKYQRLLDEFPEILEPSFNELSTKHGVTHKIQVNPEMPPCRAKVRPLMPNSEKAVKGKEASAKPEGKKSQ